MTNIVIEQQASLDIEEAAKWYENQLIGLGVEFVLEGGRASSEWMVHCLHISKSVADTRGYFVLI